MGSEGLRCCPRDTSAHLGVPWKGPGRCRGLDLAAMLLLLLLPTRCRSKEVFLGGCRVVFVASGTIAVRLHWAERSCGFT